MKKEPGKSATKIKFFWLTIGFLLASFLTAEIFNRYLMVYEKELRKSNLQENIGKSRLLMAELEQNLDMHSVLDDSLQKNFNSMEKELSKSNLTPQTAKAMESIFYSIYPKSSKLIWFSPKFKNIKPTGLRETSKKRAWQALIKCIFKPKTSSKLDYKISDGFVKTTMSDFLDSTFFNQSKYQNLEILYEGKRHYFCIHKLRPDKIMKGFLIALIPLDIAKPNWLEERALLIARRNGIVAGAYNISQDICIKNSQIGVNFLHGLKTEFSQQNQTFEMPGSFYYFDYSANIPELFLAISFKPVFNSFLQNPEKIKTIRSFLHFIFVGFAFLAVLLGNLKPMFDLSLSTRFKISSLALTAIPLAAITIMGLMQLVQMKMEYKQKQLNKLESAILRFEDKLADQTALLETQLRNANLNNAQTEPQMIKELSRLFNGLKPLGCEVAAIFTRNGNIHHFTILDQKVCNSRISYLLGFFRSQLASDGFDIQTLEAKAPLSLPGKFEKFKLLPKYDHKFSGKFNFMEFGNFKAKVFSNYVSPTTSPEKKIACLILGFEKQVMDQYLLRKLLYLNKQFDGTVFLSSKSPLGLKFLPKNQDLKKMLAAINLTGGEFTKNFKLKKQAYLALGKPLPGLETAALAVIKFKNQNTRWYIVFLFLLVAISLINSQSIYNLLVFTFLLPIKKLSAAVQNVTSGNYSEIETKPEIDELALLNNDLKKLAQGLKEKSEMQNYLSENLLESSAKNTEIKVERKNAVVLFAGIRNFSKIEKDSTPEVAMEIMNFFLSSCERNIRKNSGEIDKYIGDTAMAVFYDKENSTKEQNALQAAIDIKNELNESIKSSPDFPQNFDFGIGLAGGSLIAGHIGSLRKRLDYTIIGDVVNLAARLEKLAGNNRKAFILAEQSLAEKYNKIFKQIKIELPPIKGKTEKVSAVAVLDKIKS